MKISDFLVITAFVALVFSSCEGAPGMNGRDGRDGRDGLDGATVHNIIINVPQENWEYSLKDDNNYFVATVDMPEITKEVYIGSMIKMYRIFMDDNRIPSDISSLDEKYLSENSSQIEMPYVRLNEWFFEPGSEWLFYTETVDCEFRVGKLFIYYTASDFEYELDGHFFVPDPMLFRCAILY